MNSRFSVRGLSLGLRLRAIAAAIAVPLHLSACQGNPSVFQHVDTSRFFTNPREAAFADDVQRGDLTRVRKALGDGISPNARGTEGFRPIHFAFAARSTDVLQALLAAGADPNARLSNGNTPLHFAVRHTNSDFTSVLLAANADPNARGENDKPVLHVALDFPSTKNLELLVTSGADINTVWAGMTPLIAAIASFSWTSARVLLRLGADTKFRDVRGEDAADWWCDQLKDLPVNSKNKADVRALAAAFAERQVELRCMAAIARFD